MAYAALTTVAQVKAWMSRPGGPLAGHVADDAVIQSTILTCSELIGRYCSRTNLGEVIAVTNEMYFPTRRVSSFRSAVWDLVLRKYPVTALTAVGINATTVTVLNAAGLQAGQAGCFLEVEDEPRILKFYQTVITDPLVISVSYSAGYATPPLSLAQACVQYVAEVMRSSSNVGLRSVAMAGETTSYDPGTQFGMSARVLAMIQPFRDMCAGLGMR